MNPKLRSQLGLLRSESRFVNAEFLAEDTRRPIILSSSSPVVWLLIQEEHKRLKDC